MEKFGRFYEVVLSVGYLETIEGKPVVEQTIVVRYPLTLELNISRSIDSRINTGLFTIYGLSEKIRNIIYKDRYDFSKYIGIQVTAGYENGIWGEIFSGTVKESTSKRQSGETVFKSVMECWDGGLDVYKAVCNLSVAKGTPPMTIIQELINTMPNTQMGIVTKNLDPVLSKRGQVFIGKSFDKVQEFTEENGYIDNQKYNVIREDEYLPSWDDNFDITGSLLGIPDRNDTSIIVELLFEPQVIVGQSVILNSSTLPYLNGQYKVIGLYHEGVISGAKGGQLKTVLELFIGTTIFRPAGV